MRQLRKRETKHRRERARSHRRKPKPSRRQCERRHTDRAPCPLQVARPADKPIRENAPQQTSHRAETQRQCRIHPGLLERQPMVFHQERRQPGDEKEEPKGGTEIHPKQRPKVAAAENLSPRRGTSGGRRRRFGIAVKRVEDRAPHNAHRAEYCKRDPPSDARDHPCRKRRRQRAARPRAHPHDAVRPSAFIRLEPPRQCPGRGSETLLPRQRQRQTAPSSEQRSCSPCQ